MEFSADDAVTVLRQFRLVVCNLCHSAVLPSQIESHFAPEKPHGLTRTERREIQDYINTPNEWEADVPLIADVVELEECMLVFPHDTAEPIAALGRPHQNGFRCTLRAQKGECPYVTPDEKDIKRHCWKEHGWLEARSREGSSGKSMMPWRSKVQFQTFFPKGGPKSARFEVKRQRDSAVGRDASRRSGLKTFTGKPLPIIDHHAIGGGCDQLFLSSSDISATDMMFRQRTGWARQLRGLDRKTMLGLVKPADAAEDPRLVLIHQAFDGVVEKCLRSASLVGKEVLLAINQTDVDRVSEGPFDCSMGPEELERCTTVWKRLISYVWRIVDLDPEEMPPFDFTTRQRMALEALVGSLGATGLPEDAEGGGVATSDCPGIQDRLEASVLDCCYTLLLGGVADDEYRSSIIGGLAVLGLDPRAGWLGIEAYLPVLSGVIKLAKLFVIHRAYIKHRNESIRRQSGRPRYIDLTRPVQSLLTRVQLVVIRCGMIAPLSEQPSPLSWIMETRRFGLDLQRRTTSAELDLYNQDGCIVSRSKAVGRENGERRKRKRSESGCEGVK